MLEDRNIAAFIAALAIVGCLMAWGVIIAVDMVYLDLDTNSATAQPLKIERPGTFGTNR
jgi:hypothetical protein